MKDAFSILEYNPYVFIILIDIMIPEMDGYEEMPGFKSHKQYKHIPLIAVTSQAMAGDREKCLANGADDYILKPMDMDILIDQVNKYI